MIPSEMSFVKKLFRGTSWVLLGQIFIAGFGFITYVFLARWLEPAAYGLVPLTLTIIAVFGMFANFGIGLSTSKHISEYYPTDKSIVGSIMQAGLVLKIILGLAVSVACFIFAEKLAAFMNSPKLVPLLKIAPVAIFFSSLLEFSKSIFQGFQKFKFVTLASFLQSLTAAVVALGLVYLGYGVIGAIIGFTVSFVIVSFITTGIVFWSFYRKLPRAHAIMYGKVFNYSIPLLISFVSYFIYTKLDILMVGYFVNSAEVGFYSIAQKTMTTMLMPVVALGTTVTPMVVSLYAEKNLNQLRQLFLNFLKYSSLFVLPIIFGLIALSKVFVNIIFGEAYLPVVILIITLSIYLLTKTLGLLGGPYLIAFNQARTYAIGTAIAALGNLGLNLLLIPKYHALGAAIATITTHAIFVAILIWIIIKFLNAKLPRGLFMSMGKYLFASLIMFFVIKIMTFLIIDFKTLIFSTFVAALGYFLIIYIIKGVNREDINKFKRIILK